MGKPASDRGFWSKRRIPSSTRSSKPSPKAFACPPAGSSLRASSPRTKPSGNCLPRSWRWATIQRSLTEKAAGRRPADPFFHVAARLIYEQTRLVLPPWRWYRRELADRLETLNRDRPQAARWRFPDWLRLADIVLAHRRLPLVALFGDDPPSPDELVLNMELPYAARFVDKPPNKGARTLRPAPLDGLFERAQRLMSAVAADLTAAKNILTPLRAEIDRMPRRPAGRETSATGARKQA